MATGFCRTVLLKRGSLPPFKSCLRTIKFLESGDVTIPKPPPFDFMGKTFSMTRSIRDPTYRRLNDNTKVIVVEGNIGSGKSHLASKLAQHFGMTHFEDPTEDDIYLCNQHDPPFDLRIHNPLLPPSARYYTCEMFWNEEDLINKGKPLYLQVQFYARRHWNYAKALCHLFNTGQGVILDRSPFSEIAFSDALLKSGYLSERACRWFNQNHGLTSRNLWKPHLVVYIKASKEQIRAHLKKRNIPWEMNGRNLTDDFLDNLTETLEKSYIARMKRYSEVFVVDGSTTDVYDEDDIRTIAQKITEIDFSGEHMIRDDYKLIEWRMGLFNDRAKINARTIFSNARRSHVNQFKQLKPPMDMKEFHYDYWDREKQIAVLRMDPRTRYPPSFNPEYQSLINIMFNPFKKSKNYKQDWPKSMIWL